MADWHPIDSRGNALRVGQDLLVEHGRTVATVETIILSGEEQRNYNVDEPGVMFLSAPFGRLFIPRSFLEQDPPVLPASYFAVSNGGGMKEFEQRGQALRAQAKALVLEFMRASSDCQPGGPGIRLSPIFRACGLDWGEYKEPRRLLTNSIGLLRSCANSNLKARLSASQPLAHGVLSKRTAVSPNPSIERTSQRPLRALCAAAHVKR